MIFLWDEIVTKARSAADNRVHVPTCLIKTYLSGEWMKSAAFAAKLRLDDDMAGSDKSSMKTPLAICGICIIG